MLHEMSDLNKKAVSVSDKVNVSQEAVKPFRSVTYEFVCTDKDILLQPEVIHKESSSTQNWSDTSGSLLRRQAILRGGQKLYKCSMCPRYLTKWNLPIHTRTHTGEKPFACGICPKWFSARQNRDRHIRLMHTAGKRAHQGSERNDTCVSDKVTVEVETVKTFGCTSCQFVCTDKDNLQEHEMIHRVTEKSIVLENDGFFRCSHCPYMSTIESTVQRHEMIHAGETMDMDTSLSTIQTVEHIDPSSVLPSSSYLEAAKLQENQAFRCYHCHARFSGESEIETHSQHCTGNPPFNCHLCPATFSLLLNLRRHVVSHTYASLDSSPPTVGDTHAGSGSSRPAVSEGQSSQTPLELPAKPEPLFKCSECPRTFNLRRSLVIHTRTHTGEKPYPCSICSKRFSIANNRNRHIRLVHSPSANKGHLHKGKYFSCGVCAEKLGTLAEFSEHMKERHGVKSEPRDSEEHSEGRSAEAVIQSADIVAWRP